MSTPDVTAFVFTCIACNDWQVQAGHRARSEHGGAIALYQAIALVGHEHQTAEHSDWTPNDSMTMADGAQATGALMAQPLPRWWVDR